jgi:hypothetical protein
VKTFALLRAMSGAAISLLIVSACTSDSNQLTGNVVEDDPDAGGPSCSLDCPPDAAPPPQEPDAAPPGPVCGDGVCEVGEVCEPDCCDHPCGDGVCHADEDCPADCDDGCHEECCGDDCEPPPPEEETGCTLTQGYWKTHNEYATAPGLVSDWPAPHDEDDVMCGQTLLDILDTPSGGDAWNILAHQYIAAILNVASGASTPDAVDDALAGAEAWLLANCGGVPASEAPEAIEMAELLDRYNHGDVGPGHCD